MLFGINGRSTLPVTMKEVEISLDAIQKAPLPKYSHLPQSQKYQILSKPQRCLNKLP